MTISNKMTIRIEMIAPCGMNCHLCYSYQRVKNHCPGCNIDSNDKPNYCKVCKIKNCEEIGLNQGQTFCYNCQKFPCKKIKNLDKRYRNKYGMSMIDNLEFMRDNGIQAFILAESIKWICPGCGLLLCVHYPNCRNCGFERQL